MIYVVAHKRVSIPDIKGCRPIQVGFDPEDYPGWLRDNTGDNIAGRNGSFCELTALYWIWKNRKDDYVGLAHYRRYFGKRALSSDPRDILDEDALIRRLEGHDLLVAKPAVYHVNAREQLLMDCCDACAFDALRDVISELSPDYLEAFDAFFSGNRASQYNMLFCRRALLEDYCAWLFPVLFALEARVDLSGESDYRKRLFGFLSERLMNVWVLKNGLRARALPVVSTEYTLKDHLTYCRRDVTNGIRFRLQNMKRGK